MTGLFSFSTKGPAGLSDVNTAYPYRDAPSLIYRTYSPVRGFCRTLGRKHAPSTAQRLCHSCVVASKR